MAIYHQDIEDIELNGGSLHRSFLNHSIGLGDAAANRFGVRVFRDGVAETLSGVTCQGFFRNANGENIALTSYGTIDGNVAYVTLPQACYNVEGMFTLAIKLVGSGVTGTMRIVDGVVDNTNTGSAVAPTGSVPTYQEVLSVYEQMQAAVTNYDAKVAEQDGKISDLKSALVIANVGNVPFSGNWEIGNISSVGSDSSDNKTIRTVGRYPYDGQSYVQFTGVVRGPDDTVDRIAYVYLYDASGAYMGNSSRMLINNGVEVKLPEGAASYRLTYGYTSASGKTVSNLASMVADYGLNIISGLSYDMDKALKAVPSAEQTGGNILYGKISPIDETYQNVTFEWDGDTCHVYNPASGGATAASYTDVFADPNKMPDGVIAGKSYRVTGASANVQIRIYQAVNGSFVSSPTILTAVSDDYVSIPANATGLRMRLHILSGTELDEYITPGMSVLNQPERLVFPHKIAMFGDSITAGRDGDAGAGTHTLYEIPNTVAKRLGCAVDNLGIGSMGWVAQGSGMNAYDKISSTDLTPYDVITLCFGVNDGFQPIGNYDSTNESEVMGQFNKVINYIFTQKPAVQVIVIAPFNGCNVGSFPKYWYGNVPSTAYSRGVLSDTLKQACEYYNIPYIEQKNGPLNGFTVKKDILDGSGKSLTYMGADGVHPSNAGYKALGGWISGEIARLIG